MPPKRAPSAPPKPAASPAETDAAGEPKEDAVRERATHVVRCTVKACGRFIHALRCSHVSERGRVAKGSWAGAPNIFFYCYALLLHASDKNRQAAVSAWSKLMRVERREWLQLAKEFKYESNDIRLKFKPYKPKRKAAAAAAATATVAAQGSMPPKGAARLGKAANKTRRVKPAPKPGSHLPVATRVTKVKVGTRKGKGKAPPAKVVNPPAPVTPKAPEPRVTRSMARRAEAEMSKKEQEVHAALLKIADRMPLKTLLDPASVSELQLRLAVNTLGLSIHMYCTKLLRDAGLQPCHNLSKAIEVCAQKRLGKAPELLKQWKAVQQGGNVAKHRYEEGWYSELSALLEAL